MMSSSHSAHWFPLFEFQDWEYQSFLVLPSSEESIAAPGSAIAARKWAKGSFQCGQAFSSGEEYTLDGKLVFRPGVELDVSVKGRQGLESTPASFEAVGKGTDGPTKGAVYYLMGWIYPSLPIINGASRPLSIKGSVWAAQGPDANPETELGGMPVGDTVGFFTIVSKGAI